MKWGFKRVYVTVRNLIPSSVDRGIDETSAASSQVRSTERTQEGSVGNIS